MNSISYEIPENDWKSQILECLLATQDAVVRLDERAQNSRLREGWRQRLFFAEACACQLAEGDLVHLEDLVLLDARTYKGPAHAALASALHVLRTWRAALAADPEALLRAGRAGEGEALQPSALPNIRREEEDSEARISTPHLEAWRRIRRETASLPPLLAAAVAWDAWLTLLPEPSAAWRAPLLAALVLKARCATNSFLLPIDTGRRHSEYRRQSKQSFTQRIEGFLSWARAGALQAGKELKALALAEVMLKGKIEDCRRNSHLPALVDLFLARPLVSVPMAAAHLGISQQAASQLLPLLGSIPREVTGRKRFRAWAVG